MNRCAVGIFAWHFACERLSFYLRLDLCRHNLLRGLPISCSSIVMVWIMMNYLQANLVMA
jgi:hypothetical protein